MHISPALSKIFEKTFQCKPKFFVRSPGRVNLIGEHTDYNEGYVLPMAIEQAITIALAPRKDSLVQIYSLDYHEQKNFSLENSRDRSRPVRAANWLTYAEAITWVLQKNNFPLTGFDAVITSTIPKGAGLSSSAAFEVYSRPQISNKFF